MIVEHGGSKVFENRNLGTVPGGNRPGKVNAAALHHYVNIRIRPAKEAVPDVSAYYKGPYAKAPGGIGDHLEHRSGKKVAGDDCTTHSYPPITGPCAQIPNLRRCGQR